MKKYILIFLFGITASSFTKVKAQQEPLFNIVQVQPPPHVQQAYQDWIQTDEFWLPHQESGQWVASGLFWKVSVNDAKGFNQYSNFKGSYIVPVDMPSMGPYISAIIISNDGRSVVFSYLWGYTFWYQYVKIAQD